MSHLSRILRFLITFVMVRRNALSRTDKAVSESGLHGPQENSVRRRHFVNEIGQSHRNNHDFKSLHHALDGRTARLLQFLR